MAVSQLLPGGGSDGSGIDGSGGDGGEEGGDGGEEGGGSGGKGATFHSSTKSPLPDEYVSTMKYAV